MASGLRAKLNAIGKTMASPAPNRPARPCGVAIYSHREEADARLFSLKADGLRRIGWMGGSFDIEKVLFLDTETTGLSGGAGTVAFLVGLGYVRKDDFIVEQFLMRDYSDEPDMLSMIAERMNGFDVICSFNGKKFDVPLLETRFSLNRMRDRWSTLDQLDLMYPARRTWKLRIGSCRLSRIEEYILDQPRGEDLPGSEVPQRYFSYLKCGDMTLLEDIVAHNLQDILTLGTLLAHLCGLYETPQKNRHRQDLLSMGKALEKQGELKTARELYRIAAIPAPAGTLAALRESTVIEEAAWREFLLLRKKRDHEAMRSSLETMANRRMAPCRVYVEMAKLYEHHYKNPRRALRYARLAVAHSSEEDISEIKRRIERLEKKLRSADKEEHYGIIRHHESDQTR